MSASLHNFNPFPPLQTMNPFTLLLSEILYRPIFNILIIFLGIFGGNLGIAIILLTITIRLLLLKPSLAGNNMQKHMTDLQPKMQEIQEKYKDDPKKLSEETMKLLKTQGMGPLKGCIMLLVQIPVFIGLFFVVRKIANNEIPTEWLYSFFHSFGKDYMDVSKIQTHFLGINLLEGKNIVLAVLGALFTFLQMRLTMLVKPQTPSIPGANAPDMGKMMGFMNIFLTVMMASFVYSTASAVGLYIVTTTLFSVVQYVVQYRVLLKAKRALLFVKKK